MALVVAVLVKLLALGDHRVLQLADLFGGLGLELLLGSPARCYLLLKLQSQLLNRGAELLFFGFSRGHDFLIATLGIALALLEGIAQGQDGLLQFFHLQPQLQRISHSLSRRIVQAIMQASSQDRSGLS